MDAIIEAIMLVFQLPALIIELAANIIELAVSIISYFAERGNRKR